jgi:hypothetical protein
MDMKQINPIMGTRILEYESKKSDLDMNSNKY